MGIFGKYLRIVTWVLVVSHVEMTEDCYVLDCSLDVVALSCKELTSCPPALFKDDETQIKIRKHI